MTIVCLTLAAPQVEARKGFGSLFKLGRGAKAINGTKEYSNNTLTVDQLRVCLQLDQKAVESEKRLSSEKIPMERSQKKLKQLEYEVSSSESDLELIKNTGLYSQDQIDRFNGKADSFNGLISQYNEELKWYVTTESSYNSIVESHNKIVNDSQSNCAGKRYYEDDLIALKSSSNF